MLKDIYPEYPWDKSKFKVRGYSKKSCEFSEKLSKAIEISIRYARSTDGEYRIPTTRYSADNYIGKYNEISNIIVEFHGCDVHGCIIEDCKFRRNKSKEINRYGHEFKLAYDKTEKKIKLKPKKSQKMPKKLKLFNSLIDYLVVRGLVIQFHRQLKVNYIMNILAAIH